MNAVIVIPTLEPGERLLALVGELRSRGFNRFIMVNDGSSPA